jgi:hypothetical protein
MQITMESPDAVARQLGGTPSALRHHLSGNPAQAAKVKGQVFPLRPGFYKIAGQSGRAEHHSKIED